MTNEELEGKITAQDAKIASLLAELNELADQIKAEYASKRYVNTYVEQMLGDIMPTDNPLVDNSNIVGYTPLDIEKVLKHFKNIGGSYTLNDYRKILTAYDKAAEKGNINPYIAVAQMVKETDWGRSWWSQRPRRNPAGIGVTGEKSSQAQDKDSWAFDSNKNEWKKGYSFPSWEVAAQAHIGHLLAYAYKDEELNDDQRYLVANDPRAKFIPKETRGRVKTLKDLDGKWAVPGVGYGKSIATLANALKT